MLGALPSGTTVGYDFKEVSSSTYQTVSITVERRWAHRYAEAGPCTSFVYQLKLSSLEG